MEVVHPPTESKPLRTGDEVRFIQALAIERICQVNEERTLETVIDEIKGALRYAMVMIGLRAENIPAEEEKMVLIEYVIENYGGHTAEEIKLAFKMAVQGKLGLKPNEIKCYENFSPLYFTTIMDAYRDWAKEQVKLLAAPPERREPTSKEKAIINLEYAGWLQLLTKEGLSEVKPPLKKW
jgi:hypothetical protein